MGATGTEFALRYGATRPLLAALGMGAGVSHVALSDDAVDVQMGWAFRGQIPRNTITSVERHDKVPWYSGIGVHGNLRGAWLVNGATEGIVELSVDPAARCRVIGVRTRVSTLVLSLEDPDTFEAALRT